MGRTAKYLTREERLKARREQRAARYQLPGAKEVRALENRQAYEKAQLRANATTALPDSIRRSTSTVWAFKEKPTVARFIAGPSTLSFGELEIKDEDLHLLSFSLLRYSLGMVALPPNFEECWDELSAALYGYQIRVYMNEQISQLTLYGAQSGLEFSANLRQRYRELLSKWGKLVELIPRLEQEGNCPGLLLSRHNARWTAEQIVFAYNDLQALVKGGGDYISVLYNRHRALGRLYS